MKALEPTTSRDAGRIEPDAVVHDPEPQRVGGVIEADLDVVRGRMGRGVAYRLEAGEVDGRLHDWDDDAAVTLLRRAADAAMVGDGDRPARIVVVEGEGRPRPHDDLALRSDLLMLALTPGGRERRADELTALADRAGLRHVRTHRLGSGDLAVVLTPGGG